MHEVVRNTTQDRPANATHWSTRTIAKATGFSEKRAAHWYKHGLKPHLFCTFNVSNDPAFTEKWEAIIGLSFHPPERAIIMCANEANQIQALNTQPIADQVW